VGEGNLKSTVQQAVVQLKNIQVYSFQQDVRPFLQAAHLFVLPSNWEGFGMAIAEAMAVGRAIVSTRIGGIPELVEDGKNGFLCVPRDVDGLVEAIQQLSDRPEFLIQFGERNRLKIEQQFSLSILTERLKIFYLA
jgi:glycosyltransferase involved in cell wall biosynthesis